METKTFTRTLKAFVTLAMLQSPIIPEAFANGSGGTCKLKTECEKAYNNSKAQTALIGENARKNAGAGAYGGAGTLVGASEGTASVVCAAKTTCENAKENCKPAKGGCSPQDCEDIGTTAGNAAAVCAQAQGTAVDAGKTQAAAGGGGDGSQMMGMLAGAAMGALAAMAMQKKKKEQPPPVDPNAAWNGVQLDCSKMDAHMYQACNSQMENKCAPQMDEPTCVQFEARYCLGQGTAAVAPPIVAAMPQVDPSTGAIMGTPVMGEPGEGIGTTFCQNNIAYNFCKGAGRGDCPSCLRLQQNASAICAQNPSACIASNSSAQMQRAAQTCPSDPAFANPTWNAGTPSAGSPTTYAGGGPAVILPQSVGGKPQAGNSTGGAATSGVYGQAGGALNGAAPASAGGALREGTQNSFIGSNGSAGGAGGSSFGPSGLGGSRELASSTTNFRLSSVDAPSSEVQARFSQSLFVTSSQVIRDRCNSGRLNCP